MDLFSMAVGFLLGAVTGAAGQYLGEKYTDQRREKEVVRKLDNEWKDVEARFPQLIAEMKQDLRNPVSAHARVFFVKSSRTHVQCNEPHFSYHTDEHMELKAAVTFLEERGYIIDITPGNCPMFRMREHFVDRLKNA